MDAISSPHSVKRWQLAGTDYDPQRARSLRSETRFSAWTPRHDRTRNLQLFEERVNLVLRWFDLWTDQQRKHLLGSLFARCTRSQLRCCRDLLMETIPVTQVDFTAVLPRFLSLYVMSFLTPRDLSSAAQVSWHWRILAEQDCLWAGRCVRRVWKNHYISCVSTLDWLTPREVAERYGTLDRRSTGPTEEQEERGIRQMIRDKLQDEKSEWKEVGGSEYHPSVLMSLMFSGLSLRTRRFLTSWRVLALIAQNVQPYLPLMRVLCAKYSCNVFANHGSVFSFCRRLNNASAVLSSFIYRPALPLHLPTPALLLLVSDRIPAYELLLSGVKAGVIVVLYDHRGTLSALLTQAERAISGQRAQRLGLVAPGGTDINSCQTLRTPYHREFWEKLCGWLASTEEGGGIDVFAPLAASGRSTQTLSTLTGLEVRAPVGLATGSFQNILSEWSDSSVRAGLSDQHSAAPALLYVCESVLQGWCRQAQCMEEALQELRARLGPQLQRVSLQARRIDLEELNDKFSEQHLRRRIRLEYLTGLFMLKVYEEPLTAALNSNRAILSYANIQTVLSPVSRILELHRVFRADLEARLQQRGAEQCLGDVFVKLCSKLRVYSNYLNNYATAISTIDQVRREHCTHLLLQELLLCPVWRIQEYVTLLQALSVHTPPDHPDHTHLTAALATLLRFRDFTQRVRRLHTHTHTHTLSFLRVGTFEQVSDVGLFLFNDALVLTRRNVHHAPFALARHSTHTFLASVALGSLALREVTHTRYVSHAFVLEGPCRSWVCATERGEERDHFLSALRSAINTHSEKILADN
uniref:DH domain-containing protein n=1 Tax=Mola mola TaxID=94237 RepID=A0A3Q3XN01_MOLML